MITELDVNGTIGHYLSAQQSPLAARKRGGVGKTRGTSDDQIPVLVVRNRHQSTATIIL